MARMWPAVLPSWVRADPRRSAEVKVFRRFKETLDDSWSVFYSRPWWGIGPKGGEKDGEADFIVAHEQRGILFIEVKGGRVAYDSSASQWTSTDRHEITSDIKDPVNQALVCKHHYIKRLGALNGWPSAYVRFRHGVILPDCERPGANTFTIGGYEKLLFCFADAFDSDLAGWIVERLAAHESAGSGREVVPSQAGIELLIRLVADPVRLRVPMRRMVESDLAQFEQLLTGQQLHALSVLEALPRILVEGGAGTGKTVLAAEMAARLANRGMSVCLMCYNEPLAAHLKGLLKGRDGILVGTFHEICGLLVRSAGRDAGPVTPSFYEEVLPACAARALEELRHKHPRWGAVIVDEAQDFRENWWPVVLAMLSETNAERLAVFLDTNQALYAVQERLSDRLSATEIPLRYNLRNTRAIAKVSEPLYQGPAILSVGPDGEAPVVEERTYGAAQTEAAQRVHDLIRLESITAHDIAVLCPNESAAKRIRDELGRMRIVTTNAAIRTGDAVTVDTIRRFKGLEAAVIIVVVDRFAAESRELAYVSVTRAQSRLIVIGEVTGTLLGRALTVRQQAPT
jgi:hypothetical protein